MPGVTTLLRFGRAASGMKHPLTVTTGLGDRMALQPSTESDYIISVQAVQILNSS